MKKTFYILLYLSLFIFCNQALAIDSTQCIYYKTTIDILKLDDSLNTKLKWGDISGLTCDQVLDILILRTKVYDRLMSNDATMGRNINIIDNEKQNLDNTRKIIEGVLALRQDIIATNKWFDKEKLIEKVPYNTIEYLIKDMYIGNGKYIDDTTLKGFAADKLVTDVEGVLTGGGPVYFIGKMADIIAPTYFAYKYNDVNRYYFRSNMLRILLHYYYNKNKYSGYDLTNNTGIKNAIFNISVKENFNLKYDVDFVTWWLHGGRADVEKVDAELVINEFNNIVNKEIPGRRKKIQSMAKKPVVKIIKYPAITFGNKIKIDFSAIENTQGSGLYQAGLWRSTDEKNWGSKAVKKFTIPKANAFEFSGYLTDDVPAPKDGKYFYKVHVNDNAGNFTSSEVVPVVVSSGVAKIKNKNAIMKTTPFLWYSGEKSQQVDFAVETNPAGEVCVAFGNRNYHIDMANDYKTWKFSSTVTPQNETDPWVINVYSKTIDPKDPCLADKNKPCCNNKVKPTDSYPIPKTILYSVKGTIFEDEGKTLPLTGAKIVFGSARPDKETTSVSNGTYSIWLAPDTYRYVVSKDKHVPIIDKITVVDKNIKDFNRFLVPEPESKNLYVDVINAGNKTSYKTSSIFRFTYNGTTKPLLQISPITATFGNNDDYPNIVMKKDGASWKAKIKVRNPAKYFFRFVTIDNQGKEKPIDNNVYSFSTTKP